VFSAVNPIGKGISHQMNVRQKIAVGITDIVILVELCVSLYISSNDPENYSSVFFKYFFTMLIPTLVFARISIKRLGSGESFQP
jgi:hypothetical protein